MNKLFIIGLPRTGTTSISVALLEHFTVSHTAYTKRSFELADVISDCPCFSDYPQLDGLFPQSKFVYLQRKLEHWLPSIQMLLNKMLPSLQGENYVNPILKRSFNNSFHLDAVDDPLNKAHLVNCYRRHEQGVIDYFNGRDDCLSIDITQANSLSQLQSFLALPQSDTNTFPHLNRGKRVDAWRDIKHPHKINSHAVGKEGRKYFEYCR
ncbi:sulfotransferase [uncultured Paraglaciecola sp.]|uniref:sulfotransferase n=1 Tax=uncultured Paraglaciecola sp. TaxID=1765024 RepID=UPI00262B6AF6|nr:sulfotransferase [uncultured Paraglaciecola sp.]